MCNWSNRPLTFSAMLARHLLTRRVEALNTMPYDDAPLKFGPRGAAGVQIQLPFLIPSSMRSVPVYDFLKLFGANLPLPVEGQCVFQIISDGRMDTAPWCGIFISIAQVSGMCVKRGLRGRAYNIG